MPNFERVSTPMAIYVQLNLKGFHKHVQIFALNAVLSKIEEDGESWAMPWVWKNKFIFLRKLTSHHAASYHTPPP